MLVIGTLLWTGLGFAIWANRQALDTDNWVDTSTALSVGLGLAVVCLLLAGALRAEWAYVAGYVVQVAAIALGFLVPVMFGLGAIFAALWAGADLLGRKIERERAAAWAAYRSEQA